MMKENNTVKTTVNYSNLTLPPEFILDFGIDDELRMISLIMKDAKAMQQDKKAVFPFYLGRMKDNTPVVIDLAKISNLLIYAGKGSRRNKLLNVFLASMLYGNGQNEAREADLEIYLLDTAAKYKRKQMNFLLHRYTRRPEEMLEMMKEALNEMFKRYEIFSSVKARNITDYVQKTGEKLPWIFMVVDEYNAFNVDAVLKNSFEKVVMQLRQLGRAAGIQLVLFTAGEKKEEEESVLCDNIANVISVERKQEDAIVEGRGCVSLGNGDDIRGVWLASIKKFAMRELFEEIIELNESYFSSMLSKSGEILDEKEYEDINIEDFANANDFLEKVAQRYHHSDSSPDERMKLEDKVYAAVKQMPVMIDKLTCSILEILTMGAIRAGDSSMARKMLAAELVTIPPSNFREIHRARCMMMLVRLEDGMDSLGWVASVDRIIRDYGEYLLPHQYVALLYERLELNTLPEFQEENVYVFSDSDCKRMNTMFASYLKHKNCDERSRLQMAEYLTRLSELLEEQKLEQRYVDYCKKKAQELREAL